MRGHVTNWCKINVLHMSVDDRVRSRICPVAYTYDSRVWVLKIYSNKLLTMKKYISGIALTAMFALPFVASAASISNPLFSNGQTTIDAQGGSTVSGTFTLTVGVGEVCEWQRTQSDPSQPFVDTSVGGQLGLQEQVYTNQPFSVKVPPNTGTYYPTVQCAGIYGGGRSINGGDNVVLGSSGLGTVRVVSSGGTSGSTSEGSIFGFNSFADFLAAIKAAMTPATPPVPAVSAACVAYAQANAGTQYGVRNDANVALQGFLLSQHASIPALAAGASFGFFGSQTQAAVSWFQGANHCN